MVKLLDLLSKQYNEEDLNKILEGYKCNRYTTFRINTLKAKRVDVLKELKQNNFLLEEVSWYDKGFILLNKNEFDLRKLNCYQQGYIYLQSLSSMLPVLFLNPKENEYILDMTASPGSKTTEIAMETNNKSYITAVEKNKIRLEKLKFNLKRQGVTCCSILNVDARNLDDLFTFDKILLDAPCSGSGTININDIDSERFKIENIQKFKNTQIVLLEKALSLLKKGEKMIYSTCSILKIENEEVINKLLEKNKCKVIPIKLDENIVTLPTSVLGTVCICPNAYFEGFFIALLEKI